LIFTRFESLLFKPTDQQIYFSVTSSFDPDANFFFSSPPSSYMVEDEMNLLTDASQFDSTFSLLHLNSRSLSLMS